MSVYNRAFHPLFDILLVNKKAVAAFNIVVALRPPPAALWH